MRASRAHLRRREATKGIALITESGKIAHNLFEGRDQTLRRWGTSLTAGAETLKGLLSIQAPRYGRSRQRKLRRTRFEALEKERAASCLEEHAKRVERSDPRGILPWPGGEPCTVLGGR